MRENNATANGLESVLFPKGKGINTDAVIIQKDGDILYENYARGYAKEAKHFSWSMAKTISGILVAHAAEEGLLDIQDKISDTFPDFKGSATILDVLRMSSGIAFKEQYTGVPVDADVTKMLYMEGPKLGFGNFALSRPLNSEKPGKHFYYSSGDTNLLMELLKRKMPKDAYDAYPWERFFNPLRIDATFEQDANGTFVGSSYMYMRARDYLKVGELIMNKGTCNGTQLIPSWYVDLMTTLAPGVDKKALLGTSQTRAYSAHITTNLPMKGRNLPPEYQNLPIDALLMLGHQGQMVVSSPSQKLVIVRLATDKGAVFERDAFFKAVKELILSEGKSIETACDTHAELYASASEPSLADEDSGKAKFTDYLKLPTLMTALAAKEYCSSVYVAKRDRERCKQDLKILLPILPRLKEKKTQNGAVVTASLIPGIYSKAEFVNEKLGCRLIK